MALKLQTSARSYNCRFCSSVNPLYSEQKKEASGSMETNGPSHRRPSVVRMAFRTPGMVGLYSRTASRWNSQSPATSGPARSASQ